MIPKCYANAPPRIPRAEVEAIHATIMDHLNAVEPGCVGTIVGGYVLIALLSFFSQVKKARQISTWEAR